MSDIFDETEENLRADQWVTIAKKAAPWVSGAFGLALAIALGIWGWQSWQDNITTKSGEAYQAGVEAVAKAASNPVAGSADTATAKAKFEEVTKTGSAAYKSMAWQQLAAIAVTANKTDEAVKDFDEAAKVGADPLLSDLASLKAVYLIMDKASFADVSKRLTPLTADKRPLAALAKEALAMAKLQSGDVKGARSDLLVLSSSLGTPSGVQQRAQTIIDAIDSGAAPVAQGVAKMPEAALPQMAPGQQLQQMPSDAEAVQPAQ